MHRKQLAEVIQKYGNKPLVIRGYGTDVQRYDASYLYDFSNLRYVLGEMHDHESDITSLGIEFLQETYGLEHLADILFKGDWYSAEFKSAKEIQVWLESLKEYLIHP